MSIRTLPPLLVNQIAAGEVIERPASVVKELVENALDAGATRIDVTIENGGRDLIRVTDNGSGIAADELELAVSPHATSKIRSGDDLAAIATMGFRGEALASIASVSRLSIVSRTRGADAAARLDIEADEINGPVPASGPVGTSVTVRNLFYNTPARRKFLRTDQTEAGRISDVVAAHGLAHPRVGFSLSVGGRTTVEWPADQSPRRRALAVLGAELDEHLLEFDFTERDLSLWGLAGRPEIARSTSRNIRMFLNGRPIQDKSVIHAVREAYRGLLDPSRHPTVVLFITLDPQQVDVNVHPTKAEVRFRQQSLVHGAVLSTIRSRLRDADLTPRVHVGGERNAAMPMRDFGSGLATGESASAMGSASPIFDTSMDPSVDRSVDHSAPAGGGDAGRQFVDHFHRLDPQQKSFVYSEVKQALSREQPDALREHIEGQDQRVSTDGDPIERAGAGDDELLAAVRPVADVLQVHSSYLVTQDDDGLLIIDQHALHERVMFERLREQVSRGRLEGQRLLMPATVEADGRQVELLDELRPLLERLGIEVEPIGRSSVAVHSFTSMLFDRGVEPGEFIGDLLQRAADDGLPDDAEAALHETLDMMACKAAVKAGDRMTPQELTALLAERERVERSSNCPHGRPTTLRLSLRELEKQFGRR